MTSLLIVVGHVKDENAEDFLPIYIGRSAKDRQASILGNPFKISSTLSREQVLKLYKNWLWRHIQKQDKVYDELLSLYQLVKCNSIEEKTTLLCCWCRRSYEKSPACHGDVLKSCLQWLHKSDIN